MVKLDLIPLQSNLKNRQIKCKIRLYQIFKLIKLNRKVKLSFENKCGEHCFSINYQNNTKESQLK